MSPALPPTTHSASPNTAAPQLERAACKACAQVYNKKFTHEAYMQCNDSVVLMLCKDESHEHALALCSCRMPRYVHWSQHNMSWWGMGGMNASSSPDNDRRCLVAAPSCALLTSAIHNEHIVSISVYEVCNQQASHIP